MFDFACEELILPEGPFQNLRFRPERQPFSGLLLHAFDSGRFNRFAVTGCVQSGKTLTASVLPVLYHLFEMRQNVVYGVPSMEIATDKWRSELLPAIEKNPWFRSMLPQKGASSRGSVKVDSIQFANGAILKFASAQGGDSKRSGFTAPVAVLTEIDKMKASSTSDEADPIRQIEARTVAYGSKRRIYLECTTSVESGRIWQEYVGGAKSLFVCPCQNCNEWVTPESEHFVGYQDADDEITAGEESVFQCPNCDKSISESHRRTMVYRSRIILDGQQISKSGDVVGDGKRSETLGVRWNAFNNLFWDYQFLGRKAWTAMRAADADSAQREIQQFVWVKPFEPDDDTEQVLSFSDVQRQTVSIGRGQAPRNTKQIVLGIDVAKKQCHWTVAALTIDRKAHVFDYGIFKIDQSKPYSIAFREALGEFRNRIRNDELGWNVNAIHMALVDAHWNPREVRLGIKRLKDRNWKSSIGLGRPHMGKVTTYCHPAKRTRDVIRIGRNHYERLSSTTCVRVINFDANFFKQQLLDHFRLTEDGAMTVFNSSNPNEHLTFANHLGSEKLVKRFDDKKGYITEFQRTGKRQNHWLDSSSLCLVAAEHLNFTFEREVKKRATQAAAAPVRDDNEFDDGYSQAFRERREEYFGN